MKSRMNDVAVKCCRPTFVLMYLVISSPLLAILSIFPTMDFHILCLLLS
jgi:hypothetical protein